MKSKYNCLFTGFGFYKTFVAENRKPILIDFLNALLQNINDISEITYTDPELLGLWKVVSFPTYHFSCKNAKGDSFLIELRVIKQNQFRNIEHYYSTFPVVEQAEKGEWNYKLSAV